MAPAINIASSSKNEATLERGTRAMATLEAVLDVEREVKIAK